MTKIGYRKSLLILMSICMLLTSVGATPAPFEGRTHTTTEHFDFIYEKQDSWAVGEIIQIADDVYQELATLLEHAPKRRIPVVITSRPMQANGFYSPFPPKITLYITSPASRFLGSRTENWLKSLFVHELTHYFHLTAPVGPAKFLTPIFGPDVPAMNSIVMPGWWIEGITTYTESNLAPGGRGDSPTFAFTYEAPLLEDQMWSLAQGSYNSLNPPSGRIYTTGYLMVDHLLDTYGPSTFVDINKQYALWPFFGMKSAFKEVTGKSPKEIFADALDAVSLPTDDRSLDSTRFSPYSIGDYYLPFSTESALIGYTETPKKGDQVVIYQEDGKKTETLFAFGSSGKQNVAITIDGKNIFFTFLYSDSATRESIPLASASYSDLYLFDVDTQKISRITTKERLTHPSVSSDGKKVVAIESMQDRYRLVVIDVATQRIETLYEHNDGSVYEPHFSPDGKSVVVIEIVNGKSTLLLIDLDGNTKQLFAHSSAEFHLPRFIDNHTIWFGSDLEGRLALYEFSLETGELVRLLTDPIGILGATLWNDSVIYSTYSAQGYALKSIGVDRLERTAIDHPLAVEKVIQPPTVTEPLQAQRYRDPLRFTIWFPFTSDIPEFIPGATALFKSVLGSQVLQVSAGYQIADTVPMALVKYQYDPGPYTTTFEAVVNELQLGNRQQSIAGSLSLPIFRDPEPTSVQSLQLTVSSRYEFSPVLSNLRGLGYLSYDWTRYAAPVAYFGTTFGTAAIGMNSQYDFMQNAFSPMLVGALRGQLPIGETNQVIRLDIDGGMSLSGAPVMGLYPMGFSSQRVYGEASALVTARYRIPFGIIDQPIPYGGIIGMGLTFHGQTLVHINNEEPAWDEDVYMGATVNATIAIGGAFTMQAMGGFALSITEPIPKPLFSIGFTNLFGNEVDVFTKLRMKTSH